MFDAWCPTCEVRGLYGPRSILSLRHETDGIVAVFRCHCGTVSRTTFGSRRTTAEGAERSRAVMRTAPSHDRDENGTTFQSGDPTVKRSP